jgi:hypothetical protein
VDFLDTGGVADGAEAGQDSPIDRLNDSLNVQLNARPADAGES